MHGSGPKLIITAKREVLGDEMPDFSGDSYLEAKKKAVESSDSPEDKYSGDHHTAMKEMAEELYKASKLHAGQADKLMEICEEMYGEERDKDKSEESDDDSEDKPHKSYGDHNPYGNSKEY